jgi:hypothetical protein
MPLDQQLIAVKLEGNYIFCASNVVEEYHLLGYGAV